MSYTSCLRPLINRSLCVILKKPLDVYGVVNVKPLYAILRRFHGKNELGLLIITEARTMRKWNPECKPHREKGSRDDNKTIPSQTRWTYRKIFQPRLRLLWSLWQTVERGENAHYRVFQRWRLLYALRVMLERADHQRAIALL